MRPDEGDDGVKTVSFQEDGYVTSDRLWLAWSNPRAGMDWDLREYE